MSEERALRNQLELLQAQLATQRAQAEARQRALESALAQAKDEATQAQARADQAEARERELAAKLQPDTDPSSQRLVALARTPEDGDAVAKLIAATGALQLADARMRLRAAPPMPLVRLPQGRAEALCAALRENGLAAVTSVARVLNDAVPPARRVALKETELEVEGRTAGAAPRRLRYDSLKLLVFARRTTTVLRETPAGAEPHPLMAVSEYDPAPSSPVELGSRETRERVEHFLWLYASPEERVALGDRTQLEGPALPKALSRAAALKDFAAALRARAPQMAFDDRLVRLARFQLPYVQGGSHEVMAELLWACVQAGFSVG